MHHRHQRHTRPDGTFQLDGFSLHALWHAIGRHHHGDGGQRFGRGFGGFGDGGDGDGVPRGRKFSSQDLQLLLLTLLADAPRHGYELIKALEVQSNGFYTPSPGMVYPALTYLEELGYATVELEGNRKRYALADAGREYLAANRERVDLILARLNHFAGKMDSVRRAFAGANDDADDIDEAGSGRQRGAHRWLPELIEARHALKRALLMRVSAQAGEQRRIATILLRAAAEIAKPTDGTPE